MPPFSPGKCVVVLGAGATRGADSREGAQCLPPLNTDFFTQLQRITRPKHFDVVEAVIRDVVDLFGPNFTVSMEDYFTQLESIQRTVRRAGAAAPALTQHAVAQKRERLMAALAATLEESTDVSKRDSPVCTRHAALVATLKPRDTVISFNYDCVTDHAFRKAGTGKWSARHGYAFPRPARISGEEYWDAPNPPGSASATAYLLKLHGSLNWQLPPAATALTAPIKIKQRLYQLNGTPKFTIIPPEWSKQVDEDDNFKALWRNAERAIRNARIIALVGFSFTPTDSHVESLFRVALAGNHDLETLVVANPSIDDRRRIRSIFAPTLGRRRAVVRQFEKLKDLTGHLPDALS